MKQIKLLFFLFISIVTSSSGKVLRPLDSIRNAKTEKSSNLKFATRLHSKGQFAYGGRIVSENPVIDFNLNYDRKNWGLQIFKAIDLKDRSTQINFTLAVINKNFHVGKRLTVAPSVGFILEQSKTIADHGSDLAVILNTSYKLSKSFTLDYSTLIANLVLEPEAKDWVNRLRLTYSKKHLDLAVMGWHNNKVFDTAEYATGSASIFYSRMKLSKAVTVSAGASALVMPYTNDPVAYPKRNGLIFTLITVID